MDKRLAEQMGSMMLQILALQDQNEKLAQHVEQLKAALEAPQRLPPPPVAANGADIGVPH